MTALIARSLFPFALVIAIALWAKGYSDIGDGFSAGVVAGLGAVVQYVCLDHDEAHRRVGARWVPAIVSLGLLLVLAVGVGPMLFEFPPLSHFPRPGVEPTKLGVLELHSALLMDLGIALVAYGVWVGTFDRLFPPWKGEQE